MLAAMCLPSLRTGPEAKQDSTPKPKPAPNARAVSRVSLVMPAFTLPKPVPEEAGPTFVKTESAAPISTTSLRLSEGDAFPLVITIPAGPAWRDVFRTYGGAIGVTSSSSVRPAYLKTISPDGTLDQEAVPTIGRFMFRLSEEAIRVVNETLGPAAQILPGESAFGVFAAPFRRVVERVLHEFCTTEHVSPDDLAVVQLELGPGFGLRVASTTRRVKKF